MPTFPAEQESSRTSLALASKPQVLENCPVLGSRTALFFEQFKFRWKTPEISRKICEQLFCFPHLEHRCSQIGGGPAPQLKFHQKRLLFLQFLFSVFCLQQQLTTILKTRGSGNPSIQFLPAILTYDPKEMESFRPISCYLRPTSSLFMNVMH